MATLKELRDERLRKLAELKELGVNPYPAKATRSHSLGYITEKFDEMENQDVSVVGRIKSIRKFGKIAFIVLRDWSGDLQMFWRAGDGTVDYANSELGIDKINLLDSGDFIEVQGKVIRTKTGEISVEVSKLRLLTKSLRGIPTDQEGFTNKEERMRRRYVDMNVNDDVRMRFYRRSRFWRATRQFIDEHQFTEVNVPVL